MNYQEALQYIHAVSWRGSKPGLSRISELLSLLCDPHKKTPCLHVTGTNGKGSVCAMLDSVLRASGYNTGLYTSPYVRRFNERVMLNGTPVSDDELCALVSQIKPIAEKMTDKPTEFELITALAFLSFSNHGCDIAVVEVGMGGEFDATNVIESPVASVILSVALDHTRELGTSIEQIATTKSGIIKYGRPCVCGCDEVAAKVVAEKALREDSKLFLPFKPENALFSAEGCVMDCGDYKNITVPLLGSYQAHNLSVVLRTVDVLRGEGYRISDEALRNGLKNVRWPARFELLSKAPDVIFDGAHNPHGMSAAAKSFADIFPDKKLVLVTGMLADKDCSGAVKVIAPLARRVFTVAPPNDRALAPEKLAELYRKHGVPATACGDVSDALKQAVGFAESTGAMVAGLGSLYLYAPFYDAVETLLKNSEKS